MRKMSIHCLKTKNLTELSRDFRSLKFDIFKTKFSIMEFVLNISKKGIGKS
jgi:hypothetical protein